MVDGVPVGTPWLEDEDQAHESVANMNQEDFQYPTSQNPSWTESSLLGWQTPQPSSTTWQYEDWYGDEWTSYANYEEDDDEERDPIDEDDSRVDNRKRRYAKCGFGVLPRPLSVSGFSFRGHVCFNFAKKYMDENSLLQLTKNACSKIITKS